MKTRIRVDIVKDSIPKFAQHIGTICCPFDYAVDWGADPGVKEDHKCKLRCRRRFKHAYQAYKMQYEYTQQEKRSS